MSFVGHRSESRLDQPPSWGLTNGPPVLLLASSTTPRDFVEVPVDVMPSARPSRWTCGSDIPSSRDTFPLPSGYISLSSALAAPSHEPLTSKSHACDASASRTLPSHSGCIEVECVRVHAPAGRDDSPSFQTMDASLLSNISVASCWRSALIQRPCQGQYRQCACGSFLPADLFFCQNCGKRWPREEDTLPTQGNDGGQFMSDSDEIAPGLASRSCADHSALRSRVGPKNHYADVKITCAGRGEHGFACGPLAQSPAHGRHRSPCASPPQSRRVENISTCPLSSLLDDLPLRPVRFLSACPFPGPVDHELESPSQPPMMQAASSSVSLSAICRPAVGSEGGVRESDDPTEGSEPTECPDSEWNELHRPHRQDCLGVGPCNGPRNRWRGSSGATPSNAFTSATLTRASGVEACGIGRHLCADGAHLGEAKELMSAAAEDALRMLRGVVGEMDLAYQQHSPTAGSTDEGPTSEGGTAKTVRSLSPEAYDASALGCEVWMARPGLQEEVRTAVLQVQTALARITAERDMLQRQVAEMHKTLLASALEARRSDRSAPQRQLSPARQQDVHVVQKDNLPRDAMGADVQCEYLQDRVHEKAAAAASTLVIHSLSAHPVATCTKSTQTWGRSQFVACDTSNLPRTPQLSAATKTARFDIIPGLGARAHREPLAFSDVQSSIARGSTLTVPRVARTSQVLAEELRAAVFLDVVFLTSCLNAWGRCCGKARATRVVKEQTLERLERCLMQVASSRVLGPLISAWRCISQRRLVLRLCSTRESTKYIGRCERLSWCITAWRHALRVRREFAVFARTKPRSDRALMVRMVRLWRRCHIDGDRRRGLLLTLNRRIDADATNVVLMCWLVWASLRQCTHTARKVVGSQLDAIGRLLHQLIDCRRREWLRGWQTQCRSSAWRQRMCSALQIHFSGTSTSTSRVAELFRRWLVSAIGAIRERLESQQLGLSQDHKRACEELRANVQTRKASISVLVSAVLGRQAHRTRRWVLEHSYRGWGAAARGSNRAALRGQLLESVVLRASRRGIALVLTRGCLESWRQVARQTSARRATVSNHRCSLASLRRPLIGHCLATWRLLACRRGMVCRSAERALLLMTCALHAAAVSSVLAAWHCLAANCAQAQNVASLRPPRAVLELLAGA